MDLDLSASARFRPQLYCRKTERRHQHLEYNVCCRAGGTALFVHSRDISDPKCLIGHNKGHAEGIHIQIRDIGHRARSCIEGGNKKIAEI